MAPAHHHRTDLGRAALALALVTVAACSSPRRERLDLGPDPYADRQPPATTGGLAEGRLDRLRPAPVAEPGLPIALEDLVARALTASPDLIAARARLEARTAAVDGAGSLPEPRVTWTEFLEPVETRLGPQERRLMVTQGLPWGGAREADRDRARATARVAAAELAGAEAALRAEVEAAAWRRDRALRLAELQEQGVELLRSIQGEVDGSYRTGRAEFADLLRAGDEVALAEERAAAARDQADRETARLVAAAGGDPAGRATLRLTPAPADLTARLAARLEQLASPTLAALDHQVEGGRAAERGLAYERKSDLALGVFLIHTDPRTDAGAPPESGDDAMGLQLSFTLPIRADRYDAAERSARWDLRAARARRVAAEELLLRDVALAHEDLVAAERRIDLYAGRLVVSAAETLEAQRAAYASGRATFTDLTLAARRQLDLEAELVRARCDRELARIAIERHLGTTTER